MGNNVIFTPGARTYWHTHERGQILTVTMGTGLICSKGEAPRVLQVGDVVHIPAGETHWHGAGAGTVMAHMAVSLGSELIVPLYWCCVRDGCGWDWWDDGADGWQRRVGMRS